MPCQGLMSGAWLGHTIRATVLEPFHVLTTNLRSVLTSAPMLCVAARVSIVHAEKAGMACLRPGHASRKQQAAPEPACTACPAGPHIPAPAATGCLVSCKRDRLTAILAAQL